MRNKKKVKFEVISGTPFKDFKVNTFYVTDSIIDPQSYDDSNCTTIKMAHQCAMNLAKKLKGTVQKTTVEELEVI